MEEHSQKKRQRNNIMPTMQILTTIGMLQPSVSGCSCHDAFFVLGGNAMARQEQPQQTTNAPSATPPAR
eukprot:313793-Pyramimonas_sp.AAC.1